MSLTRRRAAACSAIVLLAGLVNANVLGESRRQDGVQPSAGAGTVATSPVAGSAVDVPRPVVAFSRAVDRAVWGPGAFGALLTNVMLHMANAFLLLVLAWWVTTKGPSAGGAAVGAALPFAVHPLLAQTVDSVAGRSDVLCATVLLAALLAARAWMRTDRVRWLLAAAGLWAMALLTNEAAVAFPLVLFAFDRLVVPGTPSDRGRRLLWLHLPLALIAAVAVAVRLVVYLFLEYRGAVSIDWRALLVGLEAATHSLRVLLWPTGRALGQATAAGGESLEARLLVAAVVFVALLGLGWRVRRSAPLATVGVLAFVLLLVPSTLLAALGRPEPMTGPPVYLVSTGLFLVVGAAAGRLAPIVSRWGPTARVFVYGAAVLWIAGLGAGTWRLGGR